MTRRIPWHIALPIVAAVFVVMMALTTYVVDTMRTALGPNDPYVGQVQRVMFFVTLLMSLGAGATAVVFTEHTLRRARRLTAVLRRHLQGERHVRALPLARDEFGELTQAFNELTDQLRRTLDQVAAEQGQLEALLNNMADGVMILDELGRIRLVNPAACRIIDRPESKILGRPFAEVTRHHDFIDIWHRCQETREEQMVAVELGQDNRFLQMIITPQEDRGASGFVVLLQDLTQIQRLRTVRRDFISNISHELRTPLASLKALVETVRDSALEDPPAARRFLNRADQEVDALTQMVEELLELSRIESGQVPLQLAPTAPRDLIKGPLERLQFQAYRNEVTVEVEVADDLPQVWADAERMRRVVTNLIHNGLKFTQAGGSISIRAFEYDPEGKHMIRQNSDERSIVFVVKDTGAGIPEHDLPRVFERFFKADRARSLSGGTGLGLAIARHIVENHKGTIWVRSTVGKGSSFYFTLPVVET